MGGMGGRLPLAIVALAVAAWASPPPSSTLDACNAENARLAQRVAELEDRLLEGSRASDDDVPDPPGTPGFTQNCCMAGVCVIFAAMAAGLTMGLVSLEPMEMEIIVKTKDKDMLHDKDKIKLKQDQAAATSVLPLLQNHHRLLVTLLLMNSIANEALPLFLDKVVPSWLAVILSVTLVLMFGEIIPSAVFTGSEQLRIAAKFAKLVSFFQCMFAPIAWPIAKVLDTLLGEDHKGRYNFAELRAIVEIHAKLGDDESRFVQFKCTDTQGLGIITTETQHHFSENSIVSFEGTRAAPAKSNKLKDDGTIYFVKPCNPLKGREQSYTFKLYTAESQLPSELITFDRPGDLVSGNFVLQERDELKIMHGVMNLTHMTAADAMVPLSEAWMMETTQRLTKEVLKDILDSGFSRIPVYSVHKHNLRGFILTKKLIVISPDDEGGKGRCVGSLGIDSLVVVPPDIFMLDLLNKFQADRCHLALVTNKPAKVLEAWKQDVAIPPDVHMAGIITLEDIIEKLLQEEIEDEHDAVKKRTNSEMVKPSTGVQLTRRHSEQVLRRESTRSPASMMEHRRGQDRAAILPLAEPLLP